MAQLFCLATAIRTGLELGGVHVAHVRASSASAGATNPGLQRKPDDCWTVPLSPREHRRQHAVGERAYWTELGVDPHSVARRLFDVSPDLELMREVLRAAYHQPTSRTRAAAAAGKVSWPPSPVGARQP